MYSGVLHLLPLAKLNIIFYILKTSNSLGGQSSFCAVEPILKNRRGDKKKEHKSKGVGELAKIKTRVYK